MPQQSVPDKVEPRSDPLNRSPTSQSSVDRLEAALHALADPRRRAMLASVFDTEMTSGDLAAEAELSRPAASQHLKLLRDSGLVHVRVDANRRLYRADTERVAAVAKALDDYWAGPLARLGERAAAEHRASASGSRRNRKLA